MKVRELAVPDAFELTPEQHRDERGNFLEWYREEVVERLVGHRMAVAQANCSVSARGSLRGIHFADVPPGQAKYVTCARGQGLDVVVDLRVGSRTFGTYDAVVLDDRARRAVYIAEGLGHAFFSLADDTTLLYLCSTGYRPDRERAVHALDPELDIGWPKGVPTVLSAKDAAAPTLEEAALAGLLPAYEDCQKWYRSLRVPEPT